MNCEDEFVIILVDCDKPNSLIVRDRLQQELETFLVQRKLTDQVKVRLGCATFPDDGNACVDLMEKSKPT